MKHVHVYETYLLNRAYYRKHLNSRHLIKITFDQFTNIVWIYQLFLLVLFSPDHCLGQYIIIIICNINNIK